MHVKSKVAIIGTFFMSLAAGNKCGLIDGFFVIVLTSVCTLDQTM